MDKIVKENGKEYVIKICPKCKKELRFSREPRGRRIHAKCLNCGQELEYEIK